MATRKKLVTNSTASRLADTSIPVVDANGDLTAVTPLTYNASYGLLKREPYGSMYLDDGAIKVTISATNTEYVVGATLYAGSCNGFTFTDNYYLLCNVAGRYKVDWGMTIDCDKNNQIVEGGIMINTTSQVQTTGSTELITGSGAPANIGGTGIIDIGVEDRVYLYVENDTGTNDLTVTHANITLIRVDDLPS